jgi:drug/metabolite transporter (DMT)-like permease
MTNLVGRVGSTRGSVAIYFVPVVAIILGVIVRDEKIHGIALAGMALVLIGAWVTSRKERSVSSQPDVVGQSFLRLLAES